MMQKFINDPVHGLIDINHSLVLDLIDNNYFQRLRNIFQLGLTNYVYPGATHSRFNHAIGCYHLMNITLQNLIKKGVSISKEEHTACCIAILLHDLGHGPFSHALEKCIFKKTHHEDISLYMMKILNQKYNGELSLAIDIFENKYHRKFFHQLISGQLDIDRLDYLTRDSFFSGVIEGKVSVDRIIKMFDVIDDILVFEEKGILSIENFLISRKIMYLQVYLHKTVLSAEFILSNFFDRLSSLQSIDKSFEIPNDLFYFLKSNDSISINESSINQFINFTDSDIWSLLKLAQKSDDYILRFISKSILNRNLYKTTQDNVFASSIIKSINIKHIDDTNYFVFDKKIDFISYDTQNEIIIKHKNQSVSPLSKYLKNMGQNLDSYIISKYFVFYPTINMIEDIN